MNLIYGNKRQDTIMFQEELKTLEETYSDRLVVAHCLSAPKQEWSDLWRSTKDKPYRTGRIDSDAIQWFLNTYPPYAQNAEYYICGPGKMIENTKKTLMSLDVPESRIFSENFGGAAIASTAKAIPNAQLKAKLRGKNISLTIKEGRTILKTLLNAGKEPPYSCEGGVCGSCVCKVIKGEVHMKKNLALTDKEVQQGLILSCQSIPLTEEVEVVF